MIRHLPVSTYKALAVCGFLCLAVGLVFGQTAGHEFVNFDDNVYVYENSQVRRGLTAEGAAWAFTQCHAASNWHPLTWLTHMLDCQLYGINPGGHHLTNVAIHAAAAVLLFLTLRSLTGRFWPSAFVAAVFAVHPLRVESVAWVSERKDVLSGLLFMLILAAYAGYARRPFSFARYALVLVLFALGLMAKPMLVTVPFVLLLLDYWPLGRLEVRGRMPEDAVSFTSSLGSQAGRLLVEKLPLLALAAGSCAVTLFAQGNAVYPAAELPWRLRFANVIMAYVGYLGQMFYPARLAVFYPYPEHSPPWWQLTAAVALLLGITATAVLWRRKHPYLLVGWLWYVGMLVPVIGLIQVGSQAMADRYTYLTLIGVTIGLAWSVADLSATWRYRRFACWTISAATIAILMGLAVRQTSYWRDSEMLWTHALNCTAHNATAHFNLADTLRRQGRIEPADRHYHQAIEINPDFARAHNDLGNTLCERELYDEAVAQYREALRIDPRCSEFHNNLGFVFSRQGKIDEAIVQFEQALEIDPRNAGAHDNLAIVLAGRGRLAEAAGHCREALDIDPGRVATRDNLGALLYHQGSIDEAVDQWKEALRSQPDAVGILRRLAWVRATCPEELVRDGAEAVELAQRAVQLSGGREPALLDALAAAYAQSGEFANAVQIASRGLALAEQQRNRDLALAIRARMRLYRAGIPYREQK